MKRHSCRRSRGHFLESARELPCDDKIDHMKTVSVRDLRYDFPKVERLLREGKDVQVTKRKRVIARLVPEPVNAQPKMPDFMARLKKIYGNKVLKVSGAELIAQERDRY